MKAYFFLINFFLSILFSAQNVAIRTLVYNLRYQPDSTNSSIILEETFLKQIKNNKETCFLSENYKRTYDMLSNSFNQSKISAGGFNLGGLPKSKFFFVIYKRGDSINYYDNVYFNKIQYVEKLDIKWKIINEKKKIRDYNCQKAETTYGGRVWVAWFTNEIPINEGPYKFSGLPGLIVELYDQMKYYDFSLKEIVVNEYEKKLFENASLKRYILVTKPEYFKIRKESQDNFVNQSGSNGISIKLEDKREIQKKIDSRNNHLELK